MRTPRSCAWTSIRCARRRAWSRWSAREDVPGSNDVGPVFPGDPLFADGIVEYAGQALFAVAAATVEQARRAARLAQVEYRELEAILTIEDALAKEATVVPSHEMRRGDPEGAIASAPHRLSGRIRMGGQDHFYLEGQVALAVPSEDGDMLVWSSTQHPSEVQHLIAKVLARPHNAVTVEVRRMGGGFGGKETQAAPFACMAALLAHHTSARSSCGSIATTTCCSPASGTTS